MTYYAVTATVSNRTRKGWNVSKQLPTFYLCAETQGIVSEAHAHTVALDILRETHARQTIAVSAVRL